MGLDMDLIPTAFSVISTFVTLVAQVDIGRRQPVGLLAVRAGAIARVGWGRSLERTTGLRKDDVVVIVVPVLLVVLIEFEFRIFVDEIFKETRLPVLR